MEYAYLRVKSGGTEKPVELSSVPLTIGRHETNRLVIKDDMASRFHCVVERKGGGAGYVLRDLQSRNGTQLNGKRVMTAELKSGDVVAIGAVEMTLVVHEVSKPGQSPASAPKSAPAAVDELEVVDDLEVVEELEELEELEVISDELEPIALVDDSEASPLKVLREKADAMPDRSCDVDALTLVNPRGQASHAGVASGDTVLLLRLILLVCFRSHASDIHLEPRADEYLLRLRVDGSLIDMVTLDKDRGTRLTALVKVMSELDTTQRNIVQEGHFASTIPVAGKGGGGRRVDYRVSFVPSLHGQKMVIRVFDTANAPMLVKDLHLPKAVADQLSEELGRDSGLILVCGPTGSGKTTTLYSLIRSCGPSFRNIVTIEDPVEVQIEGTTQLPVDEAAGKSFAALLKSVLRQDPDVIMVGEIRDPETARIALQSSMTGHLVISTIHTRDTFGTVFRLLDLGIENYMVAQGLHLVLAQRLVRALCRHCRKAHAPSEDDRRRMGKAGETVEKVFDPVGCPKCLGTGYYGRRAFFEFLITSDALREKITRNASMREMQECMGGGFVKLADHGYQLVAEGVTSIDEVGRAVGR